MEFSINDSITFLVTTLKGGIDYNYTMAPNDGTRIRYIKYHQSNDSSSIWWEIQSWMKHVNLKLWKWESVTACLVLQLGC